MNRARLLLSTVLLALLSGLLGCDVAVVAVLMSRNKSSSKSSSAPPLPDFSFALYVANFANAGAAAAEQGVLQVNGGNPSAATWTFVGRATSTAIWDTIPAGNNAALIQGPLNQIYNIDTFERLNANGAVVEVPTTANVYSNQTITTPLNAAGMLDGAAATTVITDPAHIPCIFAFFTQNIGALRVRIWGTDQIAGDCVWSNHHELPNTDVFFVGGAAASSLGTLYTTYTDATLNQSQLLTFGSSGTKNLPSYQVAGNASSTDNLGVALDSSGNVFVAATLSTGGIQLQKYTGGTTPPQWTTTFTGTGNNHIGPAGIAVASNASLIGGGTGTVIAFGGGQGTTGTHTIVRYDDLGTNGSYVWGPATLADPASNPTAWSGVAAIGTSILTTGGITNAAKVEILTQSSTLVAGSVVWPSPVTTTGGGTASNSGNGIAADGQGFAYVAGYFGSVANGKDSVLLRYKVSDGSGLTNLYQNSTFSGANEFLGIAADTDGTTYVVGYVTHTDLVSTTASGAITSMWIARFPPAGTLPVWTATFNAGTGNDQAISVSLSGNFVYVVGQNTMPGPKNGMRVFKFVK